MRDPFLELLVEAVLERALTAPGGKEGWSTERSPATGVAAVTIVPPPPDLSSDGCQ